MNAIVVALDENAPDWLPPLQNHERSTRRPFLHVLEARETPPVQPDGARAPALLVADYPSRWLTTHGWQGEAIAPLRALARIREPRQEAAAHDTLQQLLTDAGNRTPRIQSDFQVLNRSALARIPAIRVLSIAVSSMAWLPDAAWLTQPAFDAERSLETRADALLASPRTTREAHERASTYASLVTFDRARHRLRHHSLSRLIERFGTAGWNGAPREREREAWRSEWPGWRDAVAVCFESEPPLSGSQATAWTSASGGLGKLFCLGDKSHETFSTDDAEEFARALHTLDRQLDAMKVSSADLAVVLDGPERGQP